MNKCIFISGVYEPSRVALAEQLAIEHRLYWRTDIDSGGGNVVCQDSPANKIVEMFTKMKGLSKTTLTQELSKLVRLHNTATHHIILSFSTIPEELRDRYTYWGNDAIMERVCRTILDLSSPKTILLTEPILTNQVKIVGNWLSGLSTPELSLFKKITP